MQLFNLVAVLAASAYAACPAEVRIGAAKVLAGNIFNAVNQKSLGLLTNSIASPDATAQATALLGGTCQNVDASFAGMIAGAIFQGDKFLSANITEAYQTEVGYTVVKARAFSTNQIYTLHEFQFMDPNGTCALELIYWNVKEERCVA